SGVRLAEKLTPQGPDHAVSVGEKPPIHGAETGAGALMTISCGWPDSARFMSGAGPSGPMTKGVWQSWQSPVVTRYSPRFTCALVAASWARVAVGANITASIKGSRRFIVIVLSWLVRGSSLGAEMSESARFARS